MASGGHVAHIEIGTFLSSGQGPEHQELLRLIGMLVEEHPINAFWASQRQRQAGPLTTRAQSSWTQASRPPHPPCRCPLSWFDPDPCRGPAAFALMGELNLLTDGCQADRVAQLHRALDDNPIHCGDHIAFGEAGPG